MRRIVLASMVMLIACGGAKVPTHSGYKSDKSKPWTKPKVLKWNDSMETKASGDLSYRNHRRARWYAVDLPTNGELDLKIEIEPPGDAVNDDFDLAMEILDPGHRVISKADLEEDDVGELIKSRTLYDLDAGRYLIHIYLQGRLDIADYVLRGSFKQAGAAEVKSDFPEKVAFLPALPMVPINDDTPAKYRPPTTAVVTIKRRPKGKATPKPEAPEVVATSKTARILGVSVNSGGTQITVAIGTAHGAAAGWKGKIAGVPGSFTLNSCGARTCTAVVTATPDQIKAGGGNVTVSP